VHRRNLEPLAARLADHFVVHANEVVAQFGELGAIALIGPRWEPILLRPANPAYGVLVGPPATRATQPLCSIFVLVEEEGALV
jgi:hypothetical protein